MLEDTLGEIREVLNVSEEQLDSACETLWGLVGTAAADARTERVPVERLVVRVKTVWDDTAHGRNEMTSMRLQRLKQDIVTRVIKAYYMQ